MGLLNRIKMLWRAAVGASYSWPALDITLPGERYLHLVGSIHMGTRDMSPPPARLLKKIRQADALIVEADITGNETPFADLPACPPLAERLTPQQLVELESRAAELGLSTAPFDSQPLWQVAMVLQATQAQKLGLRADYGIDYQLLMAARESKVRVMELEGTDSQIALLRDLPDGGLALLEDTLTHWRTNARLLQVMIGWWLEQPPEASPRCRQPSASRCTMCSCISAIRRGARRCWRCRRGAMLSPSGRCIYTVKGICLIC